MSYTIIMDSCGDRTDEMLQSEHLKSVPLQIHVDDDVFIDDDSLDRDLLLEKIAACKSRLQSACPAPGDFLEQYESCAQGRIYVVTGTSALTGSYNSARVGMELFLESHPDAEIELFDSRSASAGEGLVAAEIMACESKKMSFQEIGQTVRKFIGNQKTRFILEDLSFLQKSGRLSDIKAIIAEKLHIVPLLTATPEGTIAQAGQARGFKRAMAKLVDQVVADCREKLPDCLFISHCSCAERAQELLSLLQEKFKNVPVIKVLRTGGISTLYAGRGGLVVSYSIDA